MNILRAYQRGIQQFKIVNVVCAHHFLTLLFLPALMLLVLRLQRLVKHLVRVQITKVRRSGKPLVVTPLDIFPLLAVVLVMLAFVILLIVLVFVASIITSRRHDMIQHMSNF